MKWVIMYTSGYPALWTYYWKQNVIHIQNYMQSVVDPILCHTMRWGSMPKVHAVVKAAYKAWHEADLKYAGSSLEEIMYMPITNNKYVTVDNHMIRTTPSQDQVLSHLVPAQQAVPVSFLRRN